ncbi:MAG: undecaprenyl-diphosphate phosphatase [Bacteroidales bacterium]|jgi:undecaprenyl-diphosphatase|nr:undecaprenyl-diphosphate phosphatase [Bacteroidales bacterium]
MEWFEALLMGIIQGVTEFLPVSSSGHLELSKAFFDLDGENNMAFTIVVHGATVLSTIVVFRKYIGDLFKGLFRFSWNDETHYIAKIVLSMIPAIIIGLLFEEELEAFFDGNLFFVGIMLLITATLLAFTYYAKPRANKLSYSHAFIIGIAQAFAILPGISRSGATIATGLLLGNRREETASFSFLMVVPVIIGANAKKLLDSLSESSSEITAATGNINTFNLLIGFMAAFFVGWLACTFMIRIVKKGKLIWFSLYCAIIGITSILVSLI